MDKQGGRVLSLDGLRALSIIFVLFGHLAGTRGFPLGLRDVRGAFISALGVRVFFVISGFLITRLLLAEEQTRGSIRLSTFYFRRIFRILVPYYAFLAAVAVASRIGWVQMTTSDFGYALTYTTNYYLDRSWAVGHTWSLAVEEQFYLLWPTLLVLLGVRRALWVAAAYVAAAPLVRLSVWYLQPELRAGIGHTFGTVADSLAVGCMLAGVRDSLWRNPRYRALLGSRWFALVPLAISPPRRSTTGRGSPSPSALWS